MSGEYNIVFEIEGLDSNQGHVRLDTLLSQLAALQSSLVRMEQLVDDRDEATLFYRLADISHASPFRFVLEPVLKAKRGKSLDVNLLKQHHDRYFSEIGRLYKKQAPSPDVSNEMLKTIQRLLAKQGSDFKTATIKNSSEKISLDETMKKNVNYFLTEESSSVGSYQGRLEAVNVHGGVNTFWIYPATGTTRIKCKFPAGSKEAVKTALEKTVIVNGKKFFRPKANFPHHIVVTEFEVVNEDPKHLLDLAGSFSNNSDETSEQAINRIRNEWD